MNTPASAASAGLTSAAVVQRLIAIRAAMAGKNVSALVVPSSDPHLSEYLPEHWQNRQWLSGFTGSVATLVVTAQEARLFADSRYWVQAEREIAGTGIALERIQSVASPAHLEWVIATLRRGALVVVDGAVLSLAASRLMHSRLAEHGIILETQQDLFAEVWTDRPALPTAAVYAHLPPHACTGRAEKMAATRASVRAHGAEWHLISTLDDIGYLFNLRGRDVHFNPVFLAHALVGPDRATLYVSPEKIDAALGATLAANGVLVEDYHRATAGQAALPPGSRLLIDPRRMTQGLYEAIPKTVTCVEAVNPTTLAKSRKSETEAGFIREAMEHDAAAMCRFYAWFEQAVGRERITELTVDERLSAERTKQPNFVSLSFATIAGFNANGALPHYRATPAAHSVIAGNGLLLIDSGAQYLGGTTDITRVWPIGSVSAEQQRDYTLVLKGTIGLSRAHFPRGTKSPMLDAIARMPLWQSGLDYGHGTGHGVGYFMNVHEGPQSISISMPESYTAMEPGMVTSIEPGVYRPGKWGVRIENLVLNVQDRTSEFGEFLKFETLTLCPIDTRCIDRSLLHEGEIAWLNAYHAEVAARVGKHVNGEAKAWLLTRTQAI